MCPIPEQPIRSVGHRDTILYTLESNHALDGAGNLPACTRFSFQQEMRRIVEIVSAIAIDYSQVCTKCLPVLHVAHKFKLPMSFVFLLFVCLVCLSCLFVLFVCLSCLFVLFVCLSCLFVCLSCLFVLFVCLVCLCVYPGE